MWKLWSVACLAEAYLLTGRLADALELAERAVGLAREQKERGYEAWALRVLGDIASRRGPTETDQAETSYRQAIALATTLGMRPLLAHCHLGLGRLHRRTGDRATAEDHVARATALFREMDMRSWLAQAEAQASR